MKSIKSVILTLVLFHASAFAYTMVDVDPVQRAVDFCAKYGLAQQRYAKSHRILANCRGVKDFRRFRNSQDGPGLVGQFWGSLNPYIPIYSAIRC